MVQSTHHLRTEVAMEIIAGLIALFVVWAVMRRGGRHNRRNWKW